METQGDRVRNEREARGWTQSELAKKVSKLYGKAVTQQNIQQLESGKVERPLFFSELCEVLGVPPKYMRSGEVPEIVGDAPPKFDMMVRDGDTSGVPQIPRVPLISWVDAGEPALAIDLFAPGDAEDWLMCPVPHSSSTYALRVEGDSMTAPYGKSFPAGVDIFVDPELRGGVVPGDLIVAKINGRDAVTFKMLGVYEGRRILKPLNPNYPPILEEFRVLGKVIYAGFKP